MQRSAPSVTVYGFKGSLLFAIVGESTLVYIAVQLPELSPTNVAEIVELMECGSPSPFKHCIYAV